MEEEDHTVSQDSNGSSVAESAASVASQPDCSAAQSFAGKITFEQFARGIAAINAYRKLAKAVYDAFREADEDRVDGLGGSGLTDELTRQLEERCGDPDTAGGSMISYMLYESGRCIASNGAEITVEDPESLWRWWQITATGPFTPATALSHQQPHDQIREGEGQ